MSGDRYKIINQHATYFCTLTVIHWIDIFTRSSYRDIVVESLNYCVDNKGVTVFSWVIMSNHIRLVTQVGPPFRFSDFLRDFKKFTSKAIIREIGTTAESRREWLLDKFSFEARRTGRAENHKVWRDDNHAIVISNRCLAENQLYPR